MREEGWRHLFEVSKLNSSSLFAKQEVFQRSTGQNDIHSAIHHQISNRSSTRYTLSILLWLRRYIRHTPQRRWSTTLQIYPSFQYLQHHHLCTCTVDLENTCNGNDRRTRREVEENLGDDIHLSTADAAMQLTIKNRYFILIVCHFSISLLPLIL